jgi:hypothetical protein
MADGAKLGQQAITLPTGNTAARPASPAFGMIRSNTTSGYLEYYDAAQSTWIGIGAFSATGGTITNVSSYNYHVFTSSGTFTVIAGTKNCEVLVVAGGGSGGANLSGGGGAGGVVYSNSAFFSTGSY